MSERGVVVVVTGLSGAGKSTALNALEDLGYFCVDNLPTSLVKPTVSECEAGGIRRIGLGIDVRVRSFLQGAAPALTSLEDGQRDVVVIFLDASDEALLRRFSETRRPHPLSAGGLSAGVGGVGVERRASHAAPSIAVLDGVRMERERLAPLRARATITLDTTALSVHELRRRVIEHLGPGESAPHRMATRLMSFGFKYGVPVDADLLFDVRFLDNPHFIAELRPLTGVDAQVRDFVLQNPSAQELLRKTEDLLAFAMPLYEREGKSYLTIGVGCTGGRHRSVALAVALAERLERATGMPIKVVHRDVARDHPGSAPEGGAK